MSLKTKVLIVRTVMVVLALVVIGLVIATFENPDTINWVFIGAGTCTILAVIHRSLVKKLKNEEN
ncbi:MAG: hypothetical protein QHH75_15015 [Bacillota bacterium]|jgi:uncharacterized membrane protein YcjF (UPF0283 family)|nr:hypothetical protein [Bacillota bacterium]